MLNLKSILYISGILLCLLASLMLIPLVVDYFNPFFPHYNFSISFFVTAFVGSSLIITCKSTNIRELNFRETFLLTTINWLLLTFFASLPFYFSPNNMSFTDSFFEAMSGLTTTGATVIAKLSYEPPGILTWRALLEWFGGIGVIVLAITILPLLRIGGMQLFQSESSDQSEKIMPRMRQISFAIGLIYLVFTIICAALLYFAGMNIFDAILHSLTTVSSGGFSPYDESIGYFNNINIERIIIIFMIMSAIPFPIYIAMSQGKFHNIFNDSQITAFFVLLIVTICFFTWHIMHELGVSFAESFRIVSFNLTSILTTTGFASTDYAKWGNFAVLIIFFLSVVGGCTGSTTGGIKLFRFQILYLTAKHQLSKLLQPHLVSQAKYNGKLIQENTATAVMSFFILFVFGFCIIAITLAFDGLDFISCLSGAAAIMANLGPALGDTLGPAGNYAPLSDFSKWILAFGMLVGRLEIFTVLVIFTHAFWKK